MQASQAVESNTVLPRAIVRRSQAIAERIKARESKPESADPEATPAEPIAQAATTVEPPATPVEPAAPAADPRESDPAYWKQRFLVTNGLLTAERRERQGETAALNQRMTELQEQLRTLQADKPAAPIDVSQFFTAEQIEQFGEEQCVAMARAATKSAQTAVQQAIEAEVKPIREAQQRTAEQTVAEAKRVFVDELARLVPDYSVIDASDDWKAWLAQEDEATGLDRGEILDKHVRLRNPQRVARLFEDFRKSRPQPLQPPVVGRGEGAGPTGEALPVPQAGLKPPTDAEVREYYKRAGLGKVKDSERVEFEARLKLRATR